jgi:hypothetical protein
VRWVRACGGRRALRLGVLRAARGGGLVAVCCSLFSSLCRWLPDLVADRGFKVIWGIFLDCDLGIFVGKVVFLPIMSD